MVKIWVKHSGHFEELEYFILGLMFDTRQLAKDYYQTLVTDLELNELQ